MDIYGLIGHPLKHSFSQRFFTEKFAKEGIDAEYHTFDIPDIALLEKIMELHKGLNGLNVTIPYKEKVIQYLDSLDPEAEKIGAVNVIKFLRDEEGLRLVGYNSDIVGFQSSIKPLINNLIHKKALILGTGGASKAVKHGLQNLGLETKFVSRTSKNGSYTYQDLSKEILSEYKVIVNSSPVGTFPDIDSSPDIPYQYLTADHLLYDLVYNPAETSFLKQGKAMGATVKNGAEMLELQAIEAWDIWNR
ncbi:shikimate dehydrogenase [Dysgonomonas sp. BGC7]|uniref:shikimate dehydrogenase family protein n=1 Tax=Dysgonomonas sp. BGC7 TaxID=1658008 RepID=UPI000681BA8C|nr:shikimate dehydrogenase [Dysgonomonas sp. BGC7]MBD8389751.1 shikimate dehydrogenase [Dysgonomonas sp. BGC7]